MNQDGLQSDVNSIDVLISLADLYIENGLISEAKGLLETAIEQTKSTAEPHCYLAKIYLEEGNREKALTILKEAEKIDAKNKTLRKLMSSIEKKEEIEIVEEEKESKISLEDSLDRLIETLLGIEGIIGVIIVDESGALITGKIDLPLDKDATGAIVSSVYNRINNVVNELGMGELRRVLYEFPKGNIFVIGSIYLRFIVLTRKNVIVSEMESKIEKVFKKTLDILGVE